MLGFVSVEARCSRPLTSDGSVDAYTAHSLEDFFWFGNIKNG